LPPKPSQAASLHHGVAQFTPVHSILLEAAALTSTIPARTTTLHDVEVKLSKTMLYRLKISEEELMLSCWKRMMWISSIVLVG
jgi:hypothetical protein